MKHSFRLAGLKNKRMLAKFLGTDLKSLRQMLSNGARMYRCFNIPKKNDRRGRRVENPKDQLKRLQRNIKSHLSQLPLPKYLSSARKGKDYKSNALIHASSRYLIKMDIRQFYPSCKREFIFQFFYKYLKMAADVAWMMTDLVTLNGYLPTGGPASQILGYWTHHHIFDDLNQLAEKRDMKMSLLVDDLVFSSEKPLPPKLPVTVNCKLRKHQLKLRRDKIKKYSATHDKNVTGVRLTKEGKALAPNGLKRKLFKSIDKYGAISDIPLREAKSLIGVLRSLRYIEGEVFPSLYGKLRQREKLYDRQQEALRKKKLSIKQPA